MGRDSSDRMRSPVRVRGSPPRRSPARRERSRERYKSSRRDESPVREKCSGRDRSPAREMPRSSSSPVRHREPQRGRSPPERERFSVHVKSPSASPRTKRLRKAQAERGLEKSVDNGWSEDRGTREGRGVEKMAEREHERTKVKLDRKLPKNYSDVTDRDYDRNHERGSDRNGHRERGVDRDADNERKERRSRRDDIDGKSSRARHGRSISPVDPHGRSRHKSRSPQPASGARERDEITDARRSERGNSEDDSVARMKAAEEALAAQQKQQPSFELSGKLAAETNRVKGVTLLFNEPPDARKPDLRWQLFVFKNGEMLNDPLYIHRQSCYLFGRERRVADVPTDHPSCSKQHAVLQFRQVANERPDGTLTKKVKPYLMDLGSTNKTFINDSPMEPQRYYELFEKDTIKFGNSSREYVLLHENSAA